MLRSCPVNLGEYHSMDFTDVAFEEGNSSDRCVDDRTLLVSKPVPILFRTEIRTNHIHINKKYFYPSVIISHRFASSQSGYIFEIDYSRVVIRNIRRLLPAQQQHENRKEKWTFNSGVFGTRQTQTVLRKKNSSEQNLCACPRSRYCHQQHQRVSIILLHGLGGRLPEAMAP